MSAQTLYDGAFGTLPAQQGWGYAAFPGQSVQTMVEQSVQLSTWPTTTEQAGYGRTAPIPLDREHGFTLWFSVNVEREQHGNRDRAGFSVILLAHDKRGIELGFWADTVFAQSDLPLFTHAEEAAFDTSAGFADYALSIRRDRYELRVNGRALLSGPVRDYTAFSGFLDPYETPDFIFLGDDTTSARASVLIRRVVLVPPPVLRITPHGVVAWSGVAGVPYTVFTGPDLLTWTPSATVTSATGECAVTNAPTSTAAWWRVAGP